MSDALVFVLAGAFATATPLFLAALGELICERSGVFNLSVEGMMSIGAVVAFITVTHTGSHALGMAAGMLAATALSTVFALLTLRLLANQVVSGLAVGLLGLGISAMVGMPYEGAVTTPIQRLHVPILADVPIVGPILFSQDAVVYMSVVLGASAAWFLRRTRAGLTLRVVGENPRSAHSLGLRPTRVRFLAVLFGGAMAGLAGAYASTVLTPLWSQGMIAGRGWIAVALVVFATWRPTRLMVGAYFFGAVSLLDLAVQAIGLGIPSQLMACVPYVSTIAILAIVSSDIARIRLNAPMSLGESYSPAA
ncbi:ABC transporter permease [Methylobacterium oryzae]|uniref:ABC transporter permease n=1 Tax=Methylobacterium oryzae TaxID=334852 RepID=A0ABU7TUF2_9HYPH